MTFTVCCWRVIHLLNESRKELKWHELLIIGRDRYYIHPFSFFKSSFSLVVEILFRDNRAPWCNNRRVCTTALNSSLSEMMRSYTHTHQGRQSLCEMIERSWIWQHCLACQLLIAARKQNLIFPTVLKYRWVSKENNEEERMKRDYLSYPFRY